jgi:formate hydrogenlyase subunit 4
MEAVVIMDTFSIVIQPFLAFLFAPLFLGVTNKTKAYFAGRKGQPLLQFYYELWKLLHKGAVYSHSTSWIFRFAPVITLASVATAALTVPLSGEIALFSFNGDLILFAYILALSRFFTVIGALDTASSFEGMGASREVTFSALAEPAFLLALTAVAKLTDHFSLSRMFSALSLETWTHETATLLFSSAAMLIVVLVENCRMPVDDPNTHLELTMIHEVMILDNSGPDLALILYSAAIKLWLFSALIVNLVVPVHVPVISVVGILATAILIGIIESMMARLQLLRVPRLLMIALAFSVLALVFGMR